MTSDALLELHNSWPGTTIDGEPGTVSGDLELSFAPDGGVYLSLDVGAAGAPPEECDYVEFVLSPEQAHALATRRPEVGPSQRAAASPSRLD